MGGREGTQGSPILRRVEVKTTISFPTQANSTNNKQATSENNKKNKIYDAGGEKKQEQREAGAEVNKITTGSKEEDRLESKTDQRADELEATTIIGKKIKFTDIK